MRVIGTVIGTTTRTILMRTHTSKYKIMDSGVVIWLDLTASCHLPGKEANQPQSFEIRSWPDLMAKYYQKFGRAEASQLLIRY